MSWEVDSQSAASMVQPVDLHVRDFVHSLDDAKNKEKLLFLDSAAQSIWNEDTEVNELKSNDVKYQKQLDEIALWFEKWNHSQRCIILEQLILIGDNNQFQLLWTAIQPVLHRDFMYSAKGRFPNEKFVPLSTEVSRATRQRLTRNRTIQKYYRTKSAYIKDENDAKKNAGLFPPIKVEQQADKKSSFQTLDSYLHFPSLHRRYSLTNPNNYVEMSRDDPTSNWRTTMHVRRHIQEDLSCDEDHPALPPNAATLYDWYSRWEGPQRATFLQLALMKLDYRQLYFLSTYLSVRRHRDILSLLSSDLAREILSFLSPADLSNCSKVSKSWRQLCLHNIVWKQKCREASLAIRPVSTPSLGGWRSVYRKDSLLKQNWKKGQYTCLQLTGHTDSVLCVVCNDKLVLSGGKDATVRMWNIFTGRQSHVFTGHQKGVWAVAIVSDHLVASGSYDRTVKIWGFGSCRTGCLRTLFGHQGPIWTMMCKKKFLATGSQDSLIKLWDMRHCRLAHTLKGHTSAVFSLDADDDMNRIYSGSADRSIRVWGVSEGICLKIIWSGEATSIMSVSFCHGLLASTSGGHVSIWNPSSGTCVRAFKAHKQRIETIKLRMTDPSATSGVVITGGKDGILKYWNVFGDGVVNKLDEHKGQINCLYADVTRIVTSSYDRSIIVWNFKEKQNHL